MSAFTSTVWLRNYVIHYSKWEVFFFPSKLAKHYAKMHSICTSPFKQIMTANEMRILNHGFKNNRYLHYVLAYLLSDKSMLATICSSSRCSSFKNASNSVSYMSLGRHSIMCDSNSFSWSINLSMSRTS